MSENKDLPQAPAASGKGLAIAGIATVLVAAVVLVVAILPAEYGIDPLGAGRALGLMDMPEGTGEAAGAAAGTAPAAITGASIVPVLEAGVGNEAPKVKGAILSQPARYNVDHREITLKPKEGMEIKYNMKKGSGLVYSWVTSKSVRYEFHGEPDVTPEGGGSDYFESYDLDYGAGKSEGHGTFVAPSTGVHGWFWENTSDEPVTLKLVTAGFYDWVFHNREEKQTALRPMDVYESPSHPTVPDVVLR